MKLPQPTSTIALQTTLKRLNLYKGKLDGIHGAKTKAANLEFQKVRSLADWLEQAPEISSTDTAYQTTVKQTKYWFKRLGFQHPVAFCNLLANFELETNYTFRPVKEAYWLSEEWRKKHLRYYPWFGRGHVQLTWLDNYKLMDWIFQLNGKLLSSPDRVLTDMKLSVAIAVIGCYFGFFTRKKFADFYNEKGINILQSRRMINGLNKAPYLEKRTFDYLTYFNL